MTLPNDNTEPQSILMGQLKSFLAKDKNCRIDVDDQDRVVSFDLSRSLAAQASRLYSGTEEWMPPKIHVYYTQSSDISDSDKSISSAEFAFTEKTSAAWHLQEVTNFFSKFLICW